MIQVVSLLWDYSINESDELGCYWTSIGKIDRISDELMGQIYEYVYIMPQRSFLQWLSSGAPALFRILGEEALRIV